MTFDDLPAVNAALNGLSAILLLIGLRFIVAGNQKAHMRCMLSAVGSSVLFLICYIMYHFKAGRTVFQNPAWFRPIYLILLLTHTVLAVAILPLIVITLSRALRQRFDKHRKIARITWPLWMYVSVTGVLIYFILYKIFPQTH